MAERLGAGKAPKKPAAAKGKGGDGRPLEPSDNRRKILEAEEAQFLSFLGKARAKGKEVAAKKEELAVIVQEEKEIFLMAQAAGFKKYEFTDILKDEKTSRKDLQESEERRTRFRTWAGQPVGSQGDMFENTPVETRDAISWESDGYASGVRAEEPKPPPECPARFTQAWMTGYHNGQARNAWALEAAAAQPAPPAVVTEEPKELTELERKRQEKAEEERVKAGLDKLGEQQIADAGGAPGDDFEASEEELAAQAGRRPPPEEGEMAAGVIHEPGTNGDDAGSDQETI